MGPMLCRLVGMMTEGIWGSDVRGVDGAVALWERLIEGLVLGMVALASVRLDTRFT